MVCGFQVARRITDHQDMGIRIFALCSIFQMIGLGAEFLSGNKLGIPVNIMFFPLALQGFNRGLGYHDHVGMVSQFCEALPDKRERWNPINNLTDILINLFRPGQSTVDLRILNDSCIFSKCRISKPGLISYPFGERGNVRHVEISHFYLFSLT